MPAVPETITAQGMVVGTIHYMAPEQLHGRETDGRADLFALGCVIYEMLLGARAFDGGTQATVTSKIIASEPEKLQDLSLLGPPELERVVRRCLAKDPDDRWQTARDVLTELKWIAEKLKGPNTTLPTVMVSAVKNLDEGKKRGRRLVWSLTAAAAALVLVGLALPWVASSGWSFPIWRGGTVPPGPTVAFAVTPHPDEGLVLDQDAGGSSIAPNGSVLAVAANKDGKTVLALRPMASLRFRIVEGSEGAAFPFWSPDSSWVGFFAGGKLKRVAAAGGLPQPICDAPEPHGGTWNAKGVILFAPNNAGPIMGVPANGGDPKPVTTLNVAEGQQDHAWPHFLPDGETFLFLSRTSRRESNQIYAAVLSNPGAPVKLVASNYRATYAPQSDGGNGNLLYLRDGTLMAQLLDVKRLTLIGQPKAAAYDIASVVESGYANFSASKNGMLVHRSGRQPGRQLHWVNRSGQAVGDVAEVSQYLAMRLSPDQSSVVATRIDNETGLVDLWLVDLARKTSTRLTADDGLNANPVWSPGGDEIVFGASPQAMLGLFRKGLNGSQGGPFGKSSNPRRPTDWSSDRGAILFEEQTQQSGWDLWVAPATSGGAPKALVQTPFNEYHGQWSPDMNWLAYTSDDSGRPEVFIQPANRPGSRLRVSIDGGSHPRWRGDGKEIFYLSGNDKLTAAPFRLDSAGKAQIGEPTPLFDLPAPYPGATDYRYDVTKDGARFLTLTTAGKTRHVMSVTVNWRMGE
jgi:hypothetical protein